MNARKRTQRPSPAAPAVVSPKKDTKTAVDTLVDLLPGSKPVAERVERVVRASHFQGPIPHPEIFKGYAEVIPDAPNRILKVFEDDSAHARDVQMGALKAQAADNKRTHWMAWSLVAGCMGLSVYFANMNKDLLAAGSFSAPLLMAATSFLRTRVEKQGEKP